MVVFVLGLIVVLVVALGFSVVKYSAYSFRGVFVSNHFIYQLLIVDVKVTLESCHLIQRKGGCSILAYSIH